MVQRIGGCVVLSYEGSGGNQFFLFGASLKIKRCAAAGDFGYGRGGEVRASRNGGCKNRANDGHRQKTRRPEDFRFALSRIAVSFVAPRHTAFCTKTAPLLIFG